MANYINNYLRIRAIENRFLIILIFVILIIQIGCINDKPQSIDLNQVSHHITFSALLNPHRYHYIDLDESNVLLGRKVRPFDIGMDWPPLSQYSWSPNGALVAFGRVPAGYDSTGTCQGCVVIADPSGVRTLVGEGDHPTWSPDGGQLAYFDSRNLVFYQLETGELKKIRTIKLVNRLGDYAKSNTKYQNTAWSPDGDQILFTIDLGIEEEIWLLDANAIEEPSRYITHGYKATWASDSSKFFFIRDFEIWEYDLTTSQETMLIQPSSLDGYSNLIWHNNVIYYLSSGYESRDIFAYDLITEETSQVTDMSEYLGYPALRLIDVK